MIWFSFLFTLFLGADSDAGIPAESLKVSPGFQIELWANVPGARSLARTGDTLFVGSGGFSHPLDRVYRVRDWNRDGKIASDEVEILIEGLDNPNGVAVRGKDLIIAEHSRLLQFTNAVGLPRDEKLSVKTAKILSFTLPSESQHGWRYIRVAPAPEEDWLYVAVGAPCNVCLPPTSKHAAIHRFNLKTGKSEIVARGVRNSVGMDFHPKTKRLWFTDNGRDNLGDDLPPDELNELVKSGSHFGYPYCYGDQRADSTIPFDKTVAGCVSTVAPRVALDAHVAALGFRFHNGDIYVAEHGSWNRSRKSGFRVSRLKNQNGKWTYEPFVTGWLSEKSQSAWGRPSDIEVLEDGSLIISDDGYPGTDNLGALYRVRAR